MSNIAYLAAGAATADRNRERMRRIGTNPKGDPLWTREEIATVRRLYPDYAAIEAALHHRRTLAAIRVRAQELDLTPHRSHWTAEEVGRLRKMYSRDSLEQLRQAFPNHTIESLRAMACYFGFVRPRRRFVPTGIYVIDQIRERCFALNLSMVDLDEMAGTGHYFRKGNWRGAPDPRRIARAIRALDGEITAKWNDTPEDHSAVALMPVTRQRVAA